MEQSGQAHQAPLSQPGFNLFLRREISTSRSNTTAWLQQNGNPLQIVVIPKETEDVERWKTAAN